MLAVLATLGACKEEKPAPVHAPEAEVSLSPYLVLDGQPVDPMCFINRNGEEAAPAFPTHDCSGGTYIANAQAPAPLPASFASTGYFYVDTSAQPPEHYPGMIGYRYLGEYHGYKTVLTMENSGGSGTFTALYLLEPQDDGGLKIAHTLAGGDRCNGGISDAALTGRTLTYSVALTPFDFLDVTKYNPKDLQPYDDLDACAICCYGYLQFVDERPNAVMLEEGALSRIQAVPEDQQTMQTCFDEVFVGAFRDRKTALSLRELRDFVEKFHKTCTAQ